MILFAYCSDGPDALSLRASEFERHGRHVGALAGQMRFGAPTSARDTDAVVGDDSLVGSLLCYEAENRGQGAMFLLGDPYVVSGAWRAVEFYTVPALTVRPPPAATPLDRWYLATLRWESAGAGFALDHLLDRLGPDLLMGGAPVCEGFGCEGPWRTATVAAFAVFRSTSLEAAQAALESALAPSDSPQGWTVLRLPRIAGSWTGVTSDFVVSEQMARR
jgi:uncharacterized protein YciI